MTSNLESKSIESKSIQQRSLELEGQKIVDLCDPGLYLGQLVELERSSQAVPWSQELFSEEFRNEGSLRLGLEFSGVLKAYLFSQVIEDELHVLNIVVSKDFRLRGIGKALLRSQILKARELGCVRALLEVRKSNEGAVALYRSLGFKVLGVRKEYYRNNREDAVLMECEILSESFD